LKGNGMSLQDDLRITAIRQLVRLAQEDRRRGIRYWYDPELTEALRELVLAPGTGPGVSGPTGGGRTRPTAADRSGAGPTRSASAGPSATGRVRSGGSDFGATAGPARPSDSGPGSRTRRPQWPPPPPAEGRVADWEAQLTALGDEALGCRACGLCETRRNVVFGTGKASVSLIFVGEAPGADEDAQGIPFVGRAGQLLTKIIEAIGLSREQVYICNVLKCRPPGNRNPAPDEIAKCSPYLAKQLELLRPKVICTLGLFATQTLLRTTAPIGKLRGRLMEYDGLKILPTYHPAALLRNPNLKAVVWEDVQLLRRILDS